MRGRIQPRRAALSSRVRAQSGTRGLIFCPTCDANGNRLRGEGDAADEKSVFVYAGATATAYMICGDVAYRIITDNQGSVRLVVNSETGEIAQCLDYDSFGRVLRDTNPGFQPFGFQGGLSDPDTDLVEFGCRWYDAETGRWFSKDPVLLDGGWNVYAFCANDPVNLTDPSGEDFMDFMFAASDFFAGFGDTISFGATRAFREAVYPEFGLTDMTDTSSGCYTVGECSGVAYDIALGAAGGWAAGSTKVKDVTEFSHWIPRRCRKKTGGKFLEKTFGKSKWNGNYVTKARHAMHDPHRYCKDIDPLPPLLRQLDRVPRVYYGLLAGGGAGATSVWVLSGIDK